MLKREQISKLKINEINQYISGYERMLQFYESYTEKKGSYNYVEERINYLNNELAEYLIAREIHIENSL
jgi:hypothetical protein